MLLHRRLSETFLARPSFRRFAVFAVVLGAFLKLGNSAPAAEPLPPNTVEEFRQFLDTDLDKLGKLDVLKNDTEKRLSATADDKKQAKDYYTKVVDSLNSQITAAVEADQKKATRLEAQLRSAADAAGVLRLHAWQAENTKRGVVKLGKPLYQDVSAKLKSAVDELVARGTPRDQAALCVMLGEDAAAARTLKGLGANYLHTLQGEIPAVVQLAQHKGPEARLVREAAAGALARMRAEPKDQIAAVELLLKEDGADVASRRNAYKALIQPFEAASPRSLSAMPNANQYSASDQLVYIEETKQLLDKQAVLALPLLVKGLKDPDADVRLISLNSLRDIGAILLVPLQRAPAALGKDVFDFDNRLRDMAGVLRRVSPLIDQFVASAPELIAVAGDPDPVLRQQALALLNDLAEARNRFVGWQSLIERGGLKVEDVQDREALPPPEKEPEKQPEKPVGAVPRLPDTLPVALEAQQPAKRPVKDLLSPALKQARLALAKNLYDPDPKIRLAALEVLENLGPDANSPETIPALLHALGDKDKYVYWNTVRIFNRFGPIEPEAVVPALIPLILGSEGDGDFAKILAPTLSAYGVKAAAAVPALTKAITVGEPDARIAYLQTLTYTGPTAADAIPTVTALLQEHDPHLRQAAAESLGRFGKLAASASTELRKLLVDENPDVRRSAGEALLRIDAK